MRAALTGSWDPTGIEVAFYRPLTTMLYALRFQWLGLDAPLYHALSLALFGLCAGLCGVFVHRATGRPGSAVVATAAYITLPVMPAAQVAWITNQMHLAESLLVLSAFLCWQWAQDRGGWHRWAAVFGLAAAACLVKEDAFMLLPTLLVLHVLWRVLVARERPWMPPVWVLVATVTVLGALLGLRWLALGKLGGYGVPSHDAAIANFWRGPRAVLAFSRIPPPWRPALKYATFSLLASAAAAALFTFRRARGEAFTVLAGLVILFGFNLPFALVSKPEQYHLIGLGGALIVSGCLSLLWQGWSNRFARGFVATFGVVMVAAMAWNSRTMASPWAPLSPSTLEQDQIVLGWAAVPEDLRDALDRKLKDRDEGPTRLGDRLPVVGYGLGGWETNPYGWRYRWTGPRVTMLVRPGAREMVLQVSASVMPHGQPVRIGLSVNGHPVPPVVLTSPAATTIPVSLRHPGPWWRPETTWVEMEVSPTWRPKSLDPSSSDERELGVMLGPVVVR